LTTRITAALNRAAPGDARARVTGPCHRLAELHPTWAAAVAECAFDLGWLDIDAGRPDDAKRDFELAMRADREGQFHRPAAAFLAMLSSDHAAAAQQFRALLAAAPVDDATPWYVRYRVAGLELGLGLAAEGAGDRDEARAAFERARSHLEATNRVHPSVAMGWRLAWLERRVR